MSLAVEKLAELDGYGHQDGDKTDDVKDFRPAGFPSEQQEERKRYPDRSEEAQDTLFCLAVHIIFRRDNQRPLEDCHPVR
jgi:hypothetical protein